MNVSQRFPKEFKVARRWFFFYAYWNRFLDQLALSLTLGGVLYSVTEYIPWLRSDMVYARAALSIAPVFLVPALAAWHLDRDTLRGLLQRWARRAPVERRLLFYFLFYVRRLVREIEELDSLLRAATGPQGKRRSKRRRIHLVRDPVDTVRRAVRKVRASVDYQRFLADLLSAPLKAPSGSFLMQDHCRIHAGRLLKTTDESYRAALVLLQSAPGGHEDASGHRSASSLAISASRAVIERGRTKLARHLAEIKRVTEPAIARAALLTTTQAGTNMMLLRLSEQLGDIWSDDTVAESVRLQRADTLLEAVDTTRTGGWLIRNLLDLPEDLRGSTGVLSHQLLEKHSSGRVRTTRNVAANPFRNHQTQASREDGRGGDDRL